ncbi:MAG: hypothetical protein R2697_03615 [Ilumatobacteraceae bacterium]
MVPTNSSKLPASVLNDIGAHDQLASGFEPVGPNPTWAISPDVAPGAEVTPSIQTCP